MHQPAASLKHSLKVRANEMKPQTKRLQRILSVDVSGLAVRSVNEDGTRPSAAPISVRTTNLNVDRRASTAARNLDKFQTGNWFVHDVQDVAVGLATQAQRPP